MSVCGGASLTRKAVNHRLSVAPEDPPRHTRAIIRRVH